MFKYGNDFFFGNAFIEKIKLIHDQSVRSVRPWSVGQIFNVFFPLSSMIFSLFFRRLVLVLSHKGEVVEAVAIVS